MSYDQPRTTPSRHNASPAFYLGHLDIGDQVEWQGQPGTITAAYPEDGYTFQPANGDNAHYVKGAECHRKDEQLELGS